MIRCFRKLNSSEIVELSTKGGYLFAPSYGDDILPQLPDLLFNSTFKPKHKELFMTNTYSEGIGYFELLFPNVVAGKQNITIDFLKKSFPDLLGDIPEGFLSPFTMKLMGYDVSKGYQIWAELLGDVLFRCATLKFASDAANYGAKVYYQEYVPKPSFTVFGGEYATHADDVLMMFGAPFLFPWEATDEERNTSFRMIRTITDFAKNG